MRKKTLKIFNCIWYFLLLILVVSILLFENVRNTYESEEGFTVKNYIKDPEKHGNFISERMVKIYSVSQDHFYFDAGNLSLKVVGSNVQKPVLGETVVYLNFRKDGVIELIDYHNYDYNYFLYGISVIALLIFLILFFKEWKLTLRGFEDA